MTSAKRQTFQDGTLDDGRKSPEWAEPKQDHGHIGVEEEEEVEMVGMEVVEEEEVTYRGWRSCSTPSCRQGAA